MTDPTNDSGQELIILPALMSFRDTAPLAFAPPPVAAVAAAARRRTRRQALTGVTAAVVLILAGSIAFASFRPNGQVAPADSPTPVPSVSSPAPDGLDDGTTIPLPAMLQTADMPDSYTVSAKPRIGYWAINDLTPCPSHDPHKDRPSKPKEATGEVAYSRGNDAINQRAWITGPEYADWQMQRARALVAECSDIGGGGMRWQMQIVDTGFAGDDSILVKWTITEAQTTTERYNAFARQGGGVVLVGVIGEPQMAKTLAQKAIDRLCSAVAC